MTKIDARIVAAMADCNLRPSEVARREYMHRNTVLYHLDKVKRETGLDAQNFYDLIKLLEIVKEEQENEQ